MKIVELFNAEFVDEENNVQRIFIIAFFSHVLDI